MSKKSLYHIQADYIKLAEQIEEAEGVLDENTEKALAISEQELTTKACNYGFVILQMENRSAAIDAEIKRLQALKKPIDNTVKRLKESVQGAMEMFGVKKIEGDTIKISFRKSNRLVTPENPDLSAIDEKFKITKTVVDLDKKAITDAIKAGEEIEGFSIGQFNNLQIK